LPGSRLIPGSEFVVSPIFHCGQAFGKIIDDIELRRDESRDRPINEKFLPFARYQGGLMEIIGAIELKAGRRS